MKVLGYGMLARRGFIWPLSALAATTAIRAETVTGYITIKDEAGMARKIAVVR